MVTILALADSGKSLYGQTTRHIGMVDITAFIKHPVFTSDFFFASSEMNLLQNFSN